MPPVEPSVAVLGEPGALEPADDGRRFFPRRVLYLQHSRPGARLESGNSNVAYNRGGTDISGVSKAPPPPCACPEASARIDRGASQEAWRRSPQRTDEGGSRL